MSTIARYGRRIAVALAMLLSPAIVALGAPFAYGIASDLLASRWLALVAVTGAALIAGYALRRRLVYAAAAKSIT
jgi:hypothetical protein